MTAWPGLELGGYRCITADPPWPYRQADRTKAEAGQRYSLMTLEELAALPVAELAHPDGAVLYLWTTNRFLATGDAAHLAVAWGFRPITVLTWGKTGQPGVGRRLRSNTEHAIVATIGKPPLPVVPPASLQQWPRNHAGRAAHSRKPAAFGDLVEAATPGPYLEMFARDQRLGWDSWGHGYETPASGPAAGERGQVVA